jgi:hypothetical protein
MMTTFTVRSSKMALPNRELIYRSDEYSFDLEPARMASYSSFLINTINLGVNQEGKIVSVWGYCPDVKWIKTKLSQPLAEQGEVYCSDPKSLKLGVSFSLNKENWPIMFDEQSGWICLSKNRSASRFIEILPHIIVGIDNTQRIVELWLRPQPDPLARKNTTGKEPGPLNPLR